jgi:hypothetical protein
MVSMFESTKDVAENSLCFVVGKATHPPQDVAHAFLPARIERPGDNPPFVPDETHREPFNGQAPCRSFGEFSAHESIQYAGDNNGHLPDSIVQAGR